MRTLLLIVIALAGSGGLLACGTEESIECRIVEASSCPSECFPLTAAPVDKERWCTGLYEVVACDEREPGSVVTIGRDCIYARPSDGEFFSIICDFQPPGWHSATLPEGVSAFPMPACAAAEAQAP